MSGLSGFDDQADNVPTGGKQGVKSLPDGDYQIQIEKAAVNSGNKGTRLEFHMTILTDGVSKGMEIDHPYYLTNKDPKTGVESLNEVAIGILKKDLSVMGFDVESWTKANGKPMSAQIPKAAATITAVKIVMNCKKSTNGNYHNLYLNERVITPNQPQTFTQEAIEKYAKGEEIPF